MSRTGLSNGVAVAAPAFPPDRPRMWTHADVMALSAERDAWSKFGDWMWQLGRASARAENTYTAADLMDAFAAGQASTAGDGEAFHRGWEACWRRFQAETGTRILPRGRRRERALTGGKARRAREAWQAAWPEHVARCKASWERGQ